MSNRNYNVFFNTHTVSGIIISIGLYVIFFAGAFSLFMENIDHWEANEKRHGLKVLDYDKAIAQVAATGYDMHGRSLNIYNYHDQIIVRSQVLTDTTLKKSNLGLLPDSVASGSFNFQLDENTYLQAASKNVKHQKTLGTFLYELHFFDQIPTAGRILAGLISVFFLFATITGVIVHWKKIAPNFFTFRLKSSLKNLWTDAHTALGVIGLPFQIMYAITGAIFCLLILLGAPMEKFVYNGDTEAMSNDIYPSFEVGSFQTAYNPKEISINDQVDKALAEFSEGEVTSVYTEIHNYHDRNAYVEIFVDSEKIEGVFNYAKFVYQLSDGELLEYKAVADTPPYAVASWDFIHIIHFGNYGGILIKVLYFLLALLTCVVIISGVMIWLTARDKKSYLHKARFNQNVGAIYLGSCLGLYPAIAFMFLLTKALPNGMEHRFTWISWLFLTFWVGYTTYSFIIKSNYKINRNALLLAGLMGVLIPVFNGFHSGMWFWKSLGIGHPDSFFVDITWMIAGIITLWLAFKIKPQKKKIAHQVPEKKREVLL